MPLPKKNTAYSFVVGLVDQASRPSFKANPTLASGDFKHSGDGSALTNLTDLPTVDPAAGRLVKITLTASEMNYDRVTIQCVDAAGSEWDDVVIYIDTTTRNVDDLCFPTVSGRSLDVSAGGEAGVDWANVGTPGSTVNLSATTVKTATDVETDTADIQSRLPAALVSGRIDASVGAMAANTLTASALASDAVTEIQSGLSTLSSADVATAVWNAATASYGSAGSYGLLVETNLDTTVSSRLASASYTAPLDAAGTRTAVGLASANLDTQLSTIAGYIDTEVAAILAAVDTEVGAIKTVTDQMAFGTANRLNVQVYGMEAGVVTAAAVATGAIDADALAADVITDIWQGTALTEAYATDGAAATPAQLLYMIWSSLSEFAISGTTITAKKLDGSTTAMTFTLDSSTTPTSRTRAS